MNQKKLIILTIICLSMSSLFAMDRLQEVLKQVESIPGLGQFGRISQTTTGSQASTADQTAFFHAIDSSNLDIIYDVLNRNIDLAKSSISGVTALEKAKEKGNAGIVWTIWTAKTFKIVPPKGLIKLLSFLPADVVLPPDVKHKL